MDSPIFAVILAMGMLPLILRGKTYLKDKCRRRARRILAEDAWKRALAEHAGAVYLIDLDDKLVRGNREFFEFLNLDPNTACGQDVMTLVHGQVETEPCPVCQARRELRDADFVKAANDPVNRYDVAIRIQVRVLRDAQGEALGILQTLTPLEPITAQVPAQAAATTAGAH